MLGINKTSFKYLAVMICLYLVELEQINCSNNLNKAVIINDRFPSGKVTEGNLLKGSGKHEIPDGDCDQTGCKVDFNIDTDMLIREGWGKIVNVRSSDGMKGELRLTIVNLTYIVDVEYMYTAVRGIQYARWGTDWTSYDGDIYERMCNMEDKTSMVTSYGDEFKEEEAIIVSNIEFCQKWQYEDWHFGWLVGLKDHQCTGYGYDSLNFGVASIMAYDTRRGLATFNVIKSPRFEGKLKIEYNEESYIAAINSEMEDSREIVINDNLKITIGSIGDVQDTDLPDFLVADVALKQVDKATNKYTGKINNWYIGSGLPDTAVIPSNGFGRYQIVKMGSDNLLFDDKEVKGTNILTSRKYKHNSINVNTGDGFMEGMIEFNNNLILGDENIRIEKNKMESNPLGNIPKNTTIENIEGNNGECTLQFFTTSPNYIDNVLLGMYNATTKLNAKAPMLPVKMDYINGMPALRSLSFKNLQKIKVDSSLIGTGLKIEYSTNKGLVTSVDEIKTVLYTNAAGSYINYRFSYVGAGGQVKLTSKDLLLNAETTFATQTGIISDILGVKAVINAVTNPEFCVEDKCISLNPNYVEPPEGGSDNDNPNTPDSGDGNADFTSFWSYIWSSFLMILINVLIILADIIIGIVVLLSCIRSFYRISKWLIFVLVFLITFGKVKIANTYLLEEADYDLSFRGVGNRTFNTYSLDIRYGAKFEGSFDLLDDLKDSFNIRKMLEDNYDVNLGIGYNGTYGYFHNNFGYINSRFTKDLVEGLIDPVPTDIVKGVLLDGFLDETKTYYQSYWVKNGDEQWYGMLINPEKRKSLKIKILDAIFKNLPNNRNCFMYHGPEDELKMLMKDEKYDGVVIHCQEKVSPWNYDADLIVFNRKSKDWHYPQTKGESRITKIEKKSVGSWNKEILLIRYVIDAAMLIYGTNKNPETIAENMLNNDYKITGDFKMTTSCSTPSSNADKKRMHFISCLSIINCLNNCTVSNQVRKFRKNNMSSKKNGIQFSTMSREGLKVLIENTKNKIEDEMSNKQQLFGTVPNDEFKAKVKNLLEGDELSLDRIKIKFGMPYKNQIGRYYGTTLLEEISTRTDLYGILQSLRNAILKGKGKEVVKIVESKDPQIIKNGMVYDSIRGGPIGYKCVGQENVGSNLVCTNLNSVSIMEKNNEDKHTTELATFAKDNNLQLSYTIVKDVALLPNDHNCIGTIFFDKDSKASCSDDCCIITIDDWQDFIITDASKIVKIGFDDQDLNNKLVKQWINTADDQILTMLNKPVGCSKCGVACMFKCARTHWPVSFWIFYLMPVWLFVFGIIMAIISMCLGIKLNVMPKKTIHRIKAHALDSSKNISDGKIKFWKEGENLREFREKYKNKDDIEKKIHTGKYTAAMTRPLKDVMRRKKE